jgi:hypothetical protein
VNAAGSAGAGPAHIDHLTHDDLMLLARLAEPGGTEAQTQAGAARLRADASLLETALASPDAAALLLDPPPPDDADAERLLRASPFLAFAVAVESIAVELKDATHVREWVGPKMRVPVLGGDDLRELLADRSRRVFLAELLASYTRVSSGTVWRETSRGWRKQRFSELDPMRMASLLDAVPETRHPAVHRRLGDLCLFLAGVFPDHTSARAFRPIDLHRLGRAAAMGGAEELGEELETRGAVGLLDHLGARWYLLAASGDAPGGSLLEAIASRFVESRRALNLLADRHLFPVRPGWFPLLP